MRIETERIIIRSIERGDEMVFAEMAKDGSLHDIGFDENCSEWIADWIDEAISLSEKDDPRADYIADVICLKEDGRVIGSVGTSYYEDLDKVGIVYFVGTEFRQKGYVSEAVEAYLDYFFDHYDENEIRANIRDANVPSWKTAEKVGFVLEEKRMYKDIDDSEEQLYRFYSVKR
ncbi:MAG: GNAT family N-acetyltransferase [Eubacterium sp.]|nr:GNAT family N-acetyltransferase [Eubacterium sp.]